MLENVKLARKLIGGFLLVTAIAAGIGIFAILQMGKINEADETLYTNVTVPLEYVVRISTHFERAAANISYCILEKDLSYLDLFDESIKEVETNIEKFDAVEFDSDVEDTFREFLTHWKDYATILQTEKKLALSGRFEEAITLRDDKATEKRRKARKALFKTFTLNIEHSREVAHNNRNVAGQATMLILMAMLLGILAALGIGFGLTRSINSPLQRIVSALRILAQGGTEKSVIVKAIAEGDLSRNVTVTPKLDIGDGGDRKDELGVLLGSASELFDVLSSLESGIAKMVLSLRENRTQEKERDWMKTGVNDLNILVQGEKRLADLTNEVLAFLSEYLNVGVSALYLFDEREDLLKIIANYAFTRRKNLNDTLRLGEGLAGQAARERKTICLSNIPEDYLAIGSAIGEAIPRAVLALPLVHDEKLMGVIEFGSFNDFKDLELEFLRQAGEVLAIAIHVNLTREQVNRLLEESQAQTEELQTQQEELQTTNEELKSQTQRLQESEEKLRAQQEELQVSNEELEEKNELLERQKQEVDKARRVIEEKAEQLALASKYKSEFLANMSHELRTPLNSLLLLSQSLVQNKTGNLTKDQVESAQIIHGSGSDLLNLINEILDLSKIEAGRMELQLGQVDMEDLAQGVRTAFFHMAEDRELDFDVIVKENAPQVIRSDRKRLEQIIKNLVSNALKFTQNGGVTVCFEQAEATAKFIRPELSPERTLAISVADTGIGIPADKQKVIFEAFQQADGSTSRKYGGTGLGLSISREITQLLGGEIQLTSRPNEGSTFTLFLPLEIDTEAPEPPRERKSAATRSSRNAKPTSSPSLSIPMTVKLRIQDDRENLGEDDNVILVIEDDPKFARVLYDKCHERGLKCVAAPTGEEGLELAKNLSPSGIILDIRLPGIDGWDVLASLKEDLRTRHIPVHIASVEENSVEAIRKGAIGHVSKPLDLEALEGIFRKIDLSKESDEKRVLIVEDNKEIRANVVQLIEGEDVAVDQASDGEQALAALRKTQYRCIVLDLNLPDTDGFHLLKMAEEEGLSLPPIIIHTAEDLSPQMEMDLQEYAESIVLKDVRSQERLLDEVSLFLHRVVSDMPDRKRQIIMNLHNTDELLKGKTILVVDDDMRTLFAVSRALTERGMNPLKAENGQKALKILEENPDIDLVLMDIMMPIMDGYEAIGKIRAQEKFRRLPIIALTAKAMKEDRERCIASGANDYMAKPVDQEKLISLMRVWLYR